MHYIDTGSFVLDLNTKDIITDLINLEHLFVFSTLSEIQEVFSN